MQRLAVVGFGDIARRAAPLLERRFALERLSRGSGFDLDSPAALDVAPADALLHCVPPPPPGGRDTRTARLLASLGWAPRRLVYLSTSGVYGDCDGALVDEQRPLNPQTARARRRHSARARHLCGRSPADRATARWHSGVMRGGRRLHESHPCR